MRSLEEVPKRRILHSWKEIAECLGVTVRSVQRWEKTNGLPVYRQGGGARGRVFAYSDELLKWAESGEPQDEGASQSPDIEREPASGRLRWLLAAASLATLLAVAGGAWWRSGWLPFGRAPNGFRFEGSRLVILDANGRVCWQKQFPSFDPEFETQVHDKVLIADIDGDGRKEVLFNFVPEHATPPGGSLLCFDDRGRQRWAHHYGQTRTFGERTFSANYRGRLIRAVKVDGRPRVLTVANHHIWYPSQTALLDPATGGLIEEYWHPGAISHCVVHDLDGDGQDEVVLAGINNPGEGLGHGAVAVLKLPFSKAPRPQPANGDPFPPITGGGELAYMLFPLSDIARVLGILPMVAHLNVEPDGRILVETMLPESGGIVYYLDSRLKVLEWRASDNLAPVHNRLYRQHLLDHALTPAEFASLGQPRYFAAAPDGNSPLLGKF